MEICYEKEGVKNAKKRCGKYRDRNGRGNLCYWERPLVFILHSSIKFLEKIEVKSGVR